MYAAATKTRRFQYNNGFKRKVILRAEECGNRAAAWDFSVSETCVRDWRKLKKSILDSKTASKGHHGPQTGRFPDLEDELADFVRKLRVDHMPVTTEVLKVKALELAGSRDLPRSQFKASRNWITRFMKRKGFSLRRRTGMCQKLPQEFEDKLFSFQRYVLSLRHSNAYQLGQIGNADQTPVYFDMPVNSTVESTGAKQVRLLSSGNEKTRITAMLTCTADGHKLAPFLVFKRKTLPKAANFPRGVIVRANEKGWMDTGLVLDWINSVWRKRPGASLGLRAMLVLDAFKCHLDQRVKDKLAACHTDLVVIPGGMTSQLQPLDVCINKPVKDRIRALYSEWLMNGCHTFTASNRLKRASIEEVARWVAQAWIGIPTALIVKAFKKCGISNAMDGTEDEMLWSESERELSESDSE